MPQPALQQLLALGLWLGSGHFQAEYFPDLGHLHDALKVSLGDQDLWLYSALFGSIEDAKEQIKPNGIHHAASGKIYEQLFIVRNGA